MATASPAKKTKQGSSARKQEPKPKTKSKTKTKKTISEPVYEVKKTPASKRSPKAAASPEAKTEKSPRGSSRGSENKSKSEIKPASKSKTASLSVKTKSRPSDIAEPSRRGGNKTSKKVIAEPIYEEQLELSSPSVKEKALSKKRNKRDDGDLEFEGTLDLVDNSRKLDARLASKNFKPLDLKPLGSTSVKAVDIEVLDPISESDDFSFSPVAKSKPLQKTAGLERNILGVPICVLNSKSAKSRNQLTHSWNGPNGEKYVFKLHRSDEDVGLPTPEHARWLHILIATFAANFNKSGVLSFTFSQILREAGLPENSQARKSLYEAIYRYQRSLAVWENSWKGSLKTWSNPFIAYSDIFDVSHVKETVNGTAVQGNTTEFKLGNDGKPKVTRKLTVKRNARSGKAIDQMHTIGFCPQVVEALMNPNTRRLISTSVFRSDMSASAYMVYTYFYGFSDESTVTRKIESLRQVFPYQGIASRFRTWLHENLEEAHKQGYVEEFKVHMNHVEVKCKNLKDIHQTIITDKPSPQEERLILTEVAGKLKLRKPKGAPRGKAFKYQSLSTEDLIAEYMKRKSEGTIPSGVCVIADTFLAKDFINKAGVKDALRDYLIKNLRE